MKSPVPLPLSDREIEQIEGALTRLPTIRAAGFSGQTASPFDILLLEGAIRNDSLIAALVAARIMYTDVPTIPWVTEEVRALKIPELPDTAAVTIRVLNELAEADKAALRERVVKKIRKR